MVTHKKAVHMSEKKARIHIKKQLTWAKKSPYMQKNTRDPNPGELGKEPLFSRNHFLAFVALCAHLVPIQLAGPIGQFGLTVEVQGWQLTSGVDRVKTGQVDKGIYKLKFNLVSLKWVK